MSFPRYPAYKDSGVEWLGEVPEHWETVPLKHLADFINGDAFKPAEWADSGMPIIRIQNLNGGEDFNYYDGVVEDRYLVHDGDLLFGWSGNRGTSFGPFRWSRNEVCALNQHIFRVVPRAIGKQALYWILKAVTAHVEDQAHGIIGMVHITKGDLGAINVPVPEPFEQYNIATFLDRETAKIDALIAEQQRLIELLQEKRQAVISHAVTKGLNPEAPMKDSGVEWLGEVPEHWSVTTIKRVVSTPVTDGPHETPEFLDEGIPFVSAEAVSRGTIDFERIRGFISIDDHNRYSQKYCPRRDDIFMVKSGATTGTSAIVETDIDFNIWSPLAVIRCGPEALPRFVLHFIRSRNFLEAVALGWSFGTQQNIGMGVVENLGIVVPPLEEQRQIISLLECAAGEANLLIVEAERSIVLLQERRSALISAAVTGQIDVRGLVPEASAG
jgi:type I restriction enzyme S subunit